MSEIRSQATPAVSVRDRMTRIARTLLVTRPYHSPSMAMLGLIDALADDGWSKPRTVNSAAELDALPVESVALFGITPGYKRHDGLWETSGVNDRFTTNEVFESLGGQPATVLFTPGDAG